MSDRIDRLEEIVERLAEIVQTHVERTEEYFDFDEQAKIDVTTVTTDPHVFKEKPVKFVWLYADGAAIQVSLDKATSGESFVIPNGAILWVRKKVKRVYGVTLAGTGTLYIWGFY